MSKKTKSFINWGNDENKYKIFPVLNVVLNELKDSIITCEEYKDRQTNEIHFVQHALQWLNYITIMSQWRW